MEYKKKCREICPKNIIPWLNCKIIDNRGGRIKSYTPLCIKILKSVEDWRYIYIYIFFFFLLFNQWWISWANIIMALSFSCDLYVTTTLSPNKSKCHWLCYWNLQASACTTKIRWGLPRLPRRALDNAEQYHCNNSSNKSCFTKLHLARLNLSRPRLMHLLVW